MRKKKGAEFSAFLLLKTIRSYRNKKINLELKKLQV